MILAGCVAAMSVRNDTREMYLELPSLVSMLEPWCGVVVMMSDIWLEPGNVDSG